MPLVAWPVLLGADEHIPTELIVFPQWPVMPLHEIIRIIPAIHVFLDWVWHDISMGGTLLHPARKYDCSEPELFLVTDPPCLPLDQLGP